MKNNYLLTFCSFFISMGMLAQEQMVKPDESKKLGGAIKSELFTTECAGTANTETTDLKWKPVLTNKVEEFEPKIPDEELIEKIKQEKLILKQQSSYYKTGSSEPFSKTATPLIGNNFAGNTSNGSSPLDNCIAISDSGIIVSVANTTIEIDDMSGTNLYYKSLATFINDPVITSVCDPFILYDRQADRFIFFALQIPASGATNSIFIMFSKTNNPATGGWWKYKLTGNPINDNSWFDYPKLAVSDSELYVTGNLFRTSGGFNQSVIYQIEKSSAYSGGTLNWQLWKNIAGAPFTLLPVGNGQGKSYGPGCYFVSISSQGGSSIKLYHLTDYISGSPVLNYYSVGTTAYSLAGNSAQLGSSCLLDNGNCRVQNGFYLNGIIHFVFHSDFGGGYSGINYNRLTVSSLTNVSKMFGTSGFDYSYPSVVSYGGMTTTDNSVMIGFGRAGSSIYPEVRVVNCDDGMNWSGSVLVKSSVSYASFTSSVKERWGDYTGTTMKHNSTNTSIWMNGMFASSTHRWNTWISEIHGNTNTGIEETGKTNNLKVFPNPVVESFTAEFSLSENSELEISIFDISGKVVKELYRGKGIQGENVFSFNKANLSAGTYFLIIKNNSSIIKNEKIVIAN